MKVPCKQVDLHPRHLFISQNLYLIYMPLIKMDVQFSDAIITDSTQSVLTAF